MKLHEVKETNFIQCRFTATRLVVLVIPVTMSFILYSSPLPISQLEHSVWLVTGVGMGYLVVGGLVAGGKLPCLVQLGLIDGWMVAFICFLCVQRLLLQDTIGLSYRLLDLVGLVLLYALWRGVGINGRVVFPFLVLGALVQVIYGQLQLYGICPSLHAVFPVTGSFFNPGPYSGFLAVVFPVALGGYIFASATHPQGRGSMVKYMSLLTVLGTLLVLSVTGSRAAWLALFASSLFLMAMRYEWSVGARVWLGHGLKRGQLLAALGLVCAGMVVGLYMLKKDSADGRLLIWKLSASMVKERPLLGIGFDKFRAEYMLAQAEYFRQHPDDPGIRLADDVAYAFNEGIQLMVEQGLVGLVLVLVLLFTVFRVKGSRERPEIWIAKAGLVSLLVFGMFSYPSHILPIKLCGLIYLAVLAAHGRRIAGRFRWRRAHGRAARILAVAGSVGVLVYVPMAYRALGDWQEAFAQYQRGDAAGALKAYRRAVAVFGREGNYLVQYGKALSVAGAHGEAVRVLGRAEDYLNNSIVQTTLGDSYLALGRYEDAEQAYQLAADMLPDRFYPRYLLAKLYAATGQREKMRYQAQYLLDKQPKVPSPAVDEIKEEMRRLLEVEEL